MQHKEEVPWGRAALHSGCSLSKVAPHLGMLLSLERMVLAREGGIHGSRSHPVSFACAVPRG